MDKVTRQCPQTTTFFEEKGEPKRYRTEVLPLTNLTRLKPNKVSLYMIGRTYTSSRDAVYRQFAVNIYTNSRDAIYRLFRAKCLHQQQLLL